MYGITTLLRVLTHRASLLILAAAWLLRSRKSRRQLALVTLTMVASCVVIGELTLDHRHLPWRPLEIDERAGFATEVKLRWLGLGPDSWCENRLKESALLTYSVLDEHRGEGDCGWSRAMDLHNSGNISLNGNSVYPMRCDLALGAHIWMQSLNYHAKQILGSELSRIRHYGTYSCRRINNRPTGKFSQHAFANAWDIAAFELADGRVVSVLDHWNNSGAKGRFLRAAHSDACRVFNVTLGPDYNALHRDHFHVDSGSGASCR